MPSECHLLGLEINELNYHHELHYAANFFVIDLNKPIT